MKIGNHDQNINVENEDKIYKNVGSVVAVFISEKGDDSFFGALAVIYPFVVIPHIIYQNIGFVCLININIFY